jgi:hypothetical protein
MPPDFHTADGPSPGAIILQSAIHVVRPFIVGFNVIELTNGNIFSKTPCFAPVISDIQTAIVSIDDIIAIFRMNPESVVVGIDYPAGPCIEVFSAVFTSGDYQV